MKLFVYCFWPQMTNLWTSLSLYSHREPKFIREFTDIQGWWNAHHMWTEALSQKDQSWTEEQPYGVPIANRDVVIWVLMKIPSLHSAPKNSSGCEVLGKSLALGPEYTVVCFLPSRNYFTQPARLHTGKAGLLTCRTCLPVSCQGWYLVWRLTLAACTASCLLWRLWTRNSYLPSSVGPTYVRLQRSHCAAK